MYPTNPHALADPEAIARRLMLIDEPHVAPLSRFAERLKEEGRGEVPYFDPLDGGTNARVLFLMEKPGPMTVASTPGGSGFISRDNDDPTATATFQFMLDAGVERGLSIIWNTIPWWNGVVKIEHEEHVLGTARLEGLFDILPNLSVVVFVGRRAERARETVKARGLQLILSTHPSPKNRAIRRTEWEAIPKQWAQALKYI